MKDSLQAALLGEIIANKVPATVFLTNGVQLRGTILDHDDTVIVLEEEHRCKIIYKQMVGVFSLKFELTDFLLNYGGHIGYAVRPSRRNCGLATRILEQGLKIAKEFGFSRILCVCDDDNYASEKVIQHNGGVFENTLFDSNENVVVKRYWIDL